MNKVILNLAVIGLVAGIAIGGTMAYFSDTATVEGNTISAGTVKLGGANNFPFQFDNLAPGQETASFDNAETYYVDYEGSVDNVDLYVAFEYEDHAGADLRDILEIALRGRSDQKGFWDWTNNNTGWQDASSFFEGWTLVASGLNSGDEAGFRMRTRALAGVPGVIYNDYQGAELMSNVVFYVVQADGDTPEFGSVETIRGENTYVRTDITQALDNAQEGDIIKVGPGVYEEDLIIDTNNVTLYSEAMATIEGKISIKANNARIDGFYVKADSDISTAPIDFNNVNNVIVQNNKVEAGANNAGIQGWSGYLQGEVVIENNEVIGGSIGVYAGGNPINATIKDNIVKDARDEGIWAYGLTEDAQLVFEGNNVINPGLTDMKIVEEPGSINGQVDSERCQAILDDNPEIDTALFEWASWTCTR